MPFSLILRERFRTFRRLFSTRSLTPSFHDAEPHGTTLNSYREFCQEVGAPQFQNHIGALSRRLDINPINQEVFNFSSRPVLLLKLSQEDLYDLLGRELPDVVFFSSSGFCNWARGKLFYFPGGESLENRVAIGAECAVYFHRHDNDNHEHAGHSHAHDPDEHKPPPGVPDFFEGLPYRTDFHHAGLQTTPLLKAYVRNLLAA